MFISDSYLLHLCSEFKTWNENLYDSQVLSGCDHSWASSTIGNVYESCNCPQYNHIRFEGWWC